DGTVTPVENARLPTLDAMVAVLPTFVGAIPQTPPAYSAVHVAGQRAYDLARRGEETTLSAKTVQIYAIDVLGYEPPFLDLEVTCGKGTYIRSLGRDLGERFGCGALVQTLRRLRVGPFTTDNAVSLDADAAIARARLRPVEEAVAELPAITLTAGELQRLRQGQALSVTHGSDEEMAVFDEGKRLAAIATFDKERRLLKPAKVFV